MRFLRYIIVIVLVALKAAVILHNTVPHSHNGYAVEENGSLHNHHHHHHGHSHAHTHTHAQPNAHEHEKSNHVHFSWIDLLTGWLSGMQHGDQGPGHFAFFTPQQGIKAPDQEPETSPFSAPSPQLLTRYAAADVVSCTDPPPLLALSDELSADLLRGPPAAL